MSKPRGNCVFIEYRGVSAIYFDRGADKFVIVAGSTPDTRRNSLKQARIFADTRSTAPSPACTRRGSPRSLRRGLRSVRSSLKAAKFSSRAKASQHPTTVRLVRAVVGC